MKVNIEIELGEEARHALNELKEYPPMFGVKIDITQEVRKILEKLANYATDEKCTLTEFIIDELSDLARGYSYSALNGGLEKHKEEVTE